MSYSQREVYYVGRHFNKSEDLLNFLLEHKAISQTSVNQWQEDLEGGECIINLVGPSDIIIENFPEMQHVDSVSGDGGMFLGYIIESKFVSKEAFDKDVEKAKEKWKNSLMKTQSVSGASNIINNVVVEKAEGSAFF